MRHGSQSQQGILDMKSGCMYRVEIDFHLDAPVNMGEFNHAATPRESFHVADG
jgi:hypothetical protein